MSVLQSLADWAGRGNYWIVQVFAMVLATLVVALVVRVVLKRLTAKAETTKNLWDDAIIKSVRQPLYWFVWLMGMSITAEFVTPVIEDSLLSLILPARKVGVIVLMTWFLVLLIKNAELNLMSPDYNEQPMDETTVSAIGKLLRMAVIITSVLVVLQSMGYSISGVLAFGGIGGIAVGFAAKDLLANFFGGLMIYLDRPFSVGDWIRSPDQEIEGVVEDIGWRLTRIRTFDKRPLYIPNSTFAHISLENPSRMTNRRIYETLGVRYSDASRLPEIISKTRDYLSQHPEIDTEQTMMVNFNKFASSSLDFFIYTFTKTTNWVRYHEIKEEVLLAVLDIIESAGAECAFPTSTLHIPDGLDVRSLAASTSQEAVQ